MTFHLCATQVLVYGLVELAFTQASKPVVISGSPAEGDTDPGFRYLLMPRRLLS